MNAEFRAAGRQVWDRVFVLCAIAVCGLLIWMSLTRGHDWGGDFAGYIMQTRSLVDGPEHMDKLRYVIENSVKRPGPVAYPWGTSLLLAVPYTMFGTDLLTLKSVNLVCYLLFLACLWVFIRERHRGVLRYCFLLLFALNPTMIGSANRVMSDMPFLAASTAAIMLIANVTTGRVDGSARLRDHLALGILIAVALFLRRNAVLLLLTLAGCQIVELLLLWAPQWTRRHGGARDVTTRRPMLRAAGRSLIPYVTCALLVLVLEGAFPADESAHVARLDLIRAAKSSAQFHDFSRLPRAFFGSLSSPGWRIDRAIHLASLPFLALGVLVRLRRDYPFAAYSLAVWGLYIIWPGHIDLRYLFPLLPFYIHFVLIGAGASWRSLEGKTARITRATATAVIVLIVIGFGWVAAKNGVNNLLRARHAPEGPNSPVTQKMFSAVRAFTRPDDVVAFYKPRILLFYTGRRSVRLVHPSQLGRADYVVLRRAGATFVEAFQGESETLMENGALVVVYESWKYQICRVALTEHVGERD
ncbi:MAG: hypothetical protein O2923_02560 [Verrucomicrobia bacterium]|nr:hypothetical protein [Verrucomicrobiota bacterium]MDA1086137.1 hypothetical protein [Verrucomicrobiota bacterium]